MDQSESILPQLHSAVRNGRLNQIKRIINGLEFTDRKLRPESFNLLCKALESGKTDIAHFLLDHGCRVNSKTTGIVTPLHLAVKKDAEDALVKKLLSRGASKTAKDQRGSIPLHLAAKRGRTSIVKLLIPANTTFGSSQHYINTPDDTGKTALQLAVEKRHYKLAALLLKKHADPNHKDKTGTTAIFSAAQVGNEEMFKLLANHGAAIDLDSNQRAGTILHFGVIFGSKEIVEHIFNNCNVDVKDFQDLLSLALSVNTRTREVSNLLIERGFRCSPNHVNDTTVSAVIKRGHTEIFKDFLEFGLDPHMRLPIFRKCECMHNTLLHEAAIFLQKDIAELLLARGVCVNTPNDLGETPFFLAIQSVCRDRVIMQSGLKLQFFEFLLKQGACTDNESKNGFISLIAPIKCGEADLLSLFLDYDANPDQSMCKCTGSNVTALHHASWDRNADLVKLLLSNGSDITKLVCENRSIFQFVQSNKNDRNSNWEPMKMSKEEMLKLLAQHVVKLQTADLLSKNTFSGPFLPPPDPDYQEICAQELIKLKNNFFVDPSISLYAILTATQEELVENLTDEMFQNILKTDVQLTLLYPVYEDLIRGKLKKAARRKKLMDKYLVILSSILSSLPQNCVRKILSFLHNQQLRRLICLSKIQLTSEEWLKRGTQWKETEIGEKKYKICKCIWQNK